MPVIRVIPLTGIMGGLFLTIENTDKLVCQLLRGKEALWKL